LVPMQVRRFTNSQLVVQGFTVAVRFQIRDFSDC
jgi:hypothetical protein